MINFNNAGEQKEGGGGNGPIPAKSIVKVRVTVRKPGPTKASDIDPILTISEKGNHYLDCEFEVISGTYEGVKIWPKYVVSGSEKATIISMAFLRAALESARGIDPKDSSQGATQARQLNGWLDFSGLELPVVVGVEKPKAGAQYITNSIMRALTPDKPEYQQVMSGGEVISDTPIPEIPQGAGNGAATSGQPAAQQNQQWGAGQTQTQTQNNSQPQQQSLLPDQGQPAQLPNQQQGQPAANTPAWA